MTSKELAKLAGVSQTTVSFCFNGSPKVSEETRKRVLALAKEHNFVLNTHARSLKTQKSNAVGMIFPKHFEDFSVNSYYKVLYSRIRKNLLQHGLELFVVYDNDFEDSEGYVLDLLRSGKVDSLISLKPSLGERIDQYLRETGTKCIYVLQDESQYRGSNSVIIDNTYGGCLVADFFAQRDFRRILTVMANVESSASQIRTAAFQSRLLELGIPFTGEDVIAVREFQFEEGFRAATELLDRVMQYDAVYVQGDIVALGFLESLRCNGINVPRDIKLVGHDDNPISSWFRPKLTTVSTAGEKVSGMVCEMLLASLEGKTVQQKAVYKPEIIVRDTCP